MVWCGGNLYSSPGCASGEIPERFEVTPLLSIRITGLASSLTGTSSLAYPQQAPIEGPHFVGLSCITFCHTGPLALAPAQCCSSSGTSSQLPASMQRSTSGRRWLSSTVGALWVPKIHSASLEVVVVVVVVVLCLRCSVISAKMVCKSVWALATALFAVWLGESQRRQQRLADRIRATYSPSLTSSATRYSGLRSVL